MDVQKPKLIKSIAVDRAEFRLDGQNVQEPARPSRGGRGRLEHANSRWHHALKYGCHGVALHSIRVGGRDTDRH